jgi:integrase
MKAPQTYKAVRTDTTANRLRTVANYLGWLGQNGTLRLDIQAATIRQQALGIMSANLIAIVLKGRGRKAVGQRDAPSKEAMDRLLEVIKPGAPDNPWDDFGLQVRNQLLVHLMYALGLRRGEVLGLKIGDHIDFRGKRLLIARTFDDPEDPRRHQPATKTRDRWLPLKDGLIDMLQNYVIRIRIKVPKARKHQFLFVSHQSGRPLSASGESKVFDQLRQCVADLPRQLTNHVLRHATATGSTSLKPPF